MRQGAAGHQQGRAARGEDEVARHDGVGLEEEVQAQRQRIAQQQDGDAVAPVGQQHDEHRAHHHVHHERCAAPVEQHGVRHQEGQRVEDHPPRVRDVVGLQAVGPPAAQGQAQAEHDGGQAPP